MCNDQEPIDLVYKWVDGDDPEYRKIKDSYQKGSVEGSNDSSTGEHRTRDNNELKYSLRSVEKHMPWVRNIFIVTSGQVPSWLNANNPKVSIVAHKEIFPDPADLPTFSSNAIDLCLYRIPGLSRRFIVMDDDFFLGRPIPRSKFIQSSEAQIIYFSVHVLRHTVYEDNVYMNACQHTVELADQKWGYTDLRLNAPIVPQLWDKSLFEELESQFEKEFKATRSNRFRTENDLVGWILFLYFLLEDPGQRGKHTSKVLHYMCGEYVEMSLFDGQLFRSLKHFVMCWLLRPAFINVNDELKEAHGVPLQKRIMQWFLRFYFMKKSQFER